MAENREPAAAGTLGKTQKRSRLLIFGLMVLALAIAFVSFWAYKEIQSAEKKLEENLSLRAGVLVEDRVGAIDTTIKSMLTAANRLIEAPMFKFFAAEVDQLPGGVGFLVAPEAGKRKNDPAADNIDKLAENVPLMVVTLRDFTSNEGFVAGRIVNRKGETYLSTLATPPALTAEEQKMVAAVVGSGKLVISPVYASALGLVNEFVLPIFPPAFEGQNAKPVAVLLLTNAVTGKNNLSELAQNSSVAAEGFVVHLIQKTSDGFQEVGLGLGGAITKIPTPAGIENAILPFGARMSVDGKEKVYSIGRQVPGTDLWIVQERSYTTSRADYEEAVSKIITLAVVASLAFAMLVAMLWWRLVGKEQEEIASQFRDLCAVIDDQKRFLDGINSTIRDPISLTDESGVYRYVNLAFASAVGRTPEEVVGLDTTAVFGFDTAKRLGVSDRLVIDSNEAVTIDETIWLQSTRHFFQISKAPLRIEDGTLSGIVSVFRDITKQVEAQERGSRMVQQTIDALVRAIEAADPFLGGHSRIMGRIAVLIGKTMHLTDREMATIEAAASLSQVGKMFVPREVLTKPGVLTSEEKKIMEHHVEYARDLLKGIEFELPVLNAVYQMNERLDGKGYPQGLSEDDISMDARVLAVANAFAAMARPRSYRPAMPVAKVLDILTHESDAYDPAVVQALEMVLKTPAGEKVVALAAASKAV